MTRYRLPRFEGPLTVGEAVWAMTRRPGGRDPIQSFADKFAEFVGVAHAIPAPSARGGLCALLHALRLPKGSEVILPGVVFHSFPWLIRQWGLEVRFADVEPGSACMDPDSVAAAITPKTAAILPVHLYGRSCNMPVLRDIAQAHDLLGIEDCAQSCGASSGGKMTGAHGVGGVFSFHHAKNLAALTWGMLTTNSDEIASEAHSWLSTLKKTGPFQLASELGSALAIRAATHPLVWRGALSPFLRAMDRAGVDPIALLFDEIPDGTPVVVSPDGLRMPIGLKARIGLSRLQRIREEAERREALANRLRVGLEGLEEITPPARAAAGEHIYLSFVAGFDDRNVVRSQLMALGVDTHVGSIWVGSRIPGFENCGETPEAERFVDRRLHLPLYHTMSDDAADYIASAVRRVVRP